VQKISPDLAFFALLRARSVLFLVAACRVTIFTAY